MAIEKIVAAGGLPAKIRFYYEVERLFDSASMRTNLRAQTIINEKTGETQEDVYAINESERNALKDFMKIAIKKIASKVLRILPGATDPVFIESTFVPAGLASLTASGVIVLDNTRYVDDVLSAMDNDIETGLRHFILEQWYVFCNLKDDATLNHNLFIESEKELSKRMLQLKKPLAT